MEFIDKHLVTAVKIMIEQSSRLSVQTARGALELEERGAVPTCDHKGSPRAEVRVGGCFGARREKCSQRKALMQQGVG